MKHDKFLALLIKMRQKATSIIHLLWWVVIPFLLFCAVEMYKHSIFTLIIL